MASLLDHLQEKLPELRPALEYHQLEHLPLRLLARGLEAHGDKMKTVRLNNWLEVGSQEKVFQARNRGRRGFE